MTGGVVAGSLTPAYSWNPFGMRAQTRAQRRLCYASQNTATRGSDFEGFEDFGGGGVVAEGFDGGSGAALAEGAHGAGVAEELFEWGVGFDGGHFSALVGFGDGGAALLEVADEVAEVFFGGDDVELHDGLEEDLAA